MSFGKILLLLVVGYIAYVWYEGYKAQQAAAASSSGSSSAATTGAATSGGTGVPPLSWSIPPGLLTANPVTWNPSPWNTIHPIISRFRGVIAGGG